MEEQVQALLAAPEEQFRIMLQDMSNDRFNALMNAMTIEQYNIFELRFRSERIVPSTAATTLYEEHPAVGSNHVYPTFTSDVDFVFNAYGAPVTQQQPSIDPQMLHQPSLRCPTCPKTYTVDKKSTFTRHKNSCAKGKRYSCDVNGCSSAFADRKDLVRHQDSVHDVDLGRKHKYRCNVTTCPQRSKGFARKDNLKRHLLSQHKVPKAQIDAVLLQCCPASS